jgi:hypothetical protein
MAHVGAFRADRGSGGERESRVHLSPGHSVLDGEAHRAATGALSIIRFM